jgi:hypothetical protein
MHLERVGAACRAALSSLAEHKPDQASQPATRHRRRVLKCVERHLLNRPEVAEAAYRAAVKRWSKAVITLRAGARVIPHGCRPRVVNLQAPHRRRSVSILIFWEVANE